MKKRQLDPVQKAINKKVATLQRSLLKYDIHMSRSDIKLWLCRVDTCYLCKKQILISEYSVDHKIPRSRNGPDILANIGLTHLACNRQKGDMTDEEFIALLAFLDHWPEMKKSVLTRLKQAGFLMRSR